MSGMKRREAREILLSLLFETEFKEGEQIEEIYELSADNREIPEDEYIKRAYFGVFENKEKIDALIEKSAEIKVANGYISIDVPANTVVLVKEKCEEIKEELWVAY